MLNLTVIFMMFLTGFMKNPQKRKKPACAGFSLGFCVALNLATGSARFASRHWPAPATWFQLQNLRLQCGHDQLVD
jgi:hypothetical protein